MTHDPKSTVRTSGPFAAQVQGRSDPHLTWAYFAALALTAILSTASTVILIGVNDLQQTKQVEVYVLAATLITLGLEASLIVIPLARKISRQRQSLLDQIAEQRRIQEALEQSDNLYRLLAQNLPEMAIIMFDRTMRYTLADGPFLERAGFKKENVEGKYARDVLPPASYEALMPVYTAALNGETTVIERAIADVIHFTRIMPTRDEAGDVIGGMILSQDVTQQRQLETRLRESEEQHRSLFENSLDAVLLTDTSGRIIRANRAACQMLDYTEKELIQLGRGGLVDSSDPRLSAALEKRARTGYFTGELTMIRRGNIKFPVEVSTQTFQSVDNVHKTSMVIRDMTGQKEAEQRTLELRLEQAKVRILSSFVTSTSHDLRTPLSIITTSTYLCRKATTPEQRQLRLDTIDEQVQRLSQIIEQLHHMASLDKTMEIHRIAVDLNALVDDVALQIRPRCAAKSLTLRTDFAAVLPLIQADQTYLRDALRLIAENAVLYTPEGGSITLSTVHDGSCVEVQIADTGIGISPEYLPHIFERFYKIDQARNDALSGAGLGLTMAKRIVDEHQGNITVESQPGVGTTVRIALPIPA